MGRSLWKILGMFTVIVMAFVSCRKDPEATPPPPTGRGNVVDLDLQAAPYQLLSQYGFFSQPMASLQPVSGVVPYDVITPLFTDYASKSRFIWMPAGTSAQVVADDQVLNMPNGTVLLKNFYYDNVLPDGGRRIIETRMLFKRNDQWEYANYLWNEEQTDAALDLNGSYAAIQWTDPDGSTRSVNYRVPSSAECFTCHKRDSEVFPIGPKPQNLARTYPYQDGVMDQLQKLEQVGYLTGGYTTPIDAVVKWDDVSFGLEERVRSYLDANCAHCHAHMQYCDYRPLRLSWSASAHPDSLGICVPPDDQFIPALTHIVSRGNIQRSMLHYRLNTTEENVRMPLLGRSLIHDEGVALIAEWIASLEPACP